MKCLTTLKLFSAKLSLAAICCSLSFAYWAPAALGQGTLAYSFEGGDFQGFVANGAGIMPLTLDTIGATEGTSSLKISIAQGGTYVGALTDLIDPAIIGNPPGVVSMSFDLTIPTAFPAEGFVDIFPVFFALQVGTTEPAVEVSFQPSATSRISVGDLEPGTYPITMVLDSTFHPLDFENFDPRPFNEIFGDGSNPIDMVPISMQITVNKSTQAPWVGYVDNIRFSSEATVATPGDFDGDGNVDGRDFLVWQRGGTTPPLDAGRLTEWQGNYGFGGLTAGFAAVPEPTCGLLAIMVAVIGLSCGRMR